MKTTWNLDLLYKSHTVPSIGKDIEESKRLVSSFCEKWKENNEYLDNPQVLKEALDDYEKLLSQNVPCDKPMYYLGLKNTLDLSNTEIKGRLNKVGDVVVKLSNELQFFELNISKIAPAQQKKFLSSEYLKEYKHFLEQLFLSSKYLLTDKEEKIFNLTGKTSYSNWVNMLDELLNKQEVEIIDEEGSLKKVSYNEISKYLDSKDKKVRDYAAEKFNAVNDKYVEIAEFEINSVLENKKISDEYRGLPRPDLARHIADDINPEVVDTLLEVVTKNFDISQKYYKKKAKLLGQERLGYHERNVPLGDIDLEYSYKEAMELVTKTFKNIDPLFAKTIQRFSKNGQYDVFPKTNKTGGAFCTSSGKTLPTYILLNHNKKLNDVLTIAHESGHGIHTEMSKIQNALNAGYPTSLAEVASTFFEDFVLEEILKDADENTKFTILAQKLNSDISAIFRQVAFYNFEKELHKDFREKGYLNRKHISELFSKHMSSYLGESVNKDKGMENGWLYWTHLRMYFYVYSYASGLLISKGLQALVREDPKNVELVKEFLRSGSTKSPKELFESMGTDILKKEIWQKGIDSIKRDLKVFEKR